MDTRSTDGHGRRMTLADFPAAEVEPILKSLGENMAGVQQLERDYEVADRAGDENAKRKLNARLQPIYQRLASLHT